MQTDVAIHVAGALTIHTTSSFPYSSAFPNTATGAGPLMPRFLKNLKGA